MMTDDNDAMVVTPEAFWQSVRYGENGLGDYAHLGLMGRTFKYLLDSAFSAGFREAIQNAEVIFALENKKTKICITAKSALTIDSATQTLNQNTLAKMQQYGDANHLDRIAEFFMQLAEAKRQQQQSDRNLNILLSEPVE